MQRLKYKTTDIDKIPQVKPGVFTRLGGVGAGLYDSLNCAWSAHDTPENTAENRARVARALDIKPENFVTVTQIHSANVVMVTAPWGAKDAPKADGLVTKTPGIAIGILTADCAPVLFSSKDGTVIGAAHAGWKGAVGGVLEATVAAMRDLGAKAEDIVAAVGPCIGPLSYEVDTAFEAPFLAQDAANERFFTKQNEDKYLFDLPG